MRVVAIASQKGGSGKTTLTGHLAIAAERAGQGPVALIDCDPQGSLADWWNARKSDTPKFVKSHVLRLREDVERVRASGIAHLFIDTPPAITSMIKQVIEVADLVVIPIRPSPHDLRAAGATVEMVETIGRPMIFVVNAITPRTLIAAETALALSQHGTVAPVMITHRTEYAASMIDGRTVMEITRAGRSAAEIGDLWTYVEGRLRRGQTRQQSTAPAAPPRITGVR